MKYMTEHEVAIVVLEDLLEAAPGDLGKAAERRFTEHEEFFREVLETAILCLTEYWEMDKLARELVTRDQESGK